MKELTIKKAQELIGKMIAWEVQGYYANGFYAGTDKIVSVNPAKRWPIDSQLITGDGLWHAFTDRSFDGLCYSDSGRMVMYKVVE